MRFTGVSYYTINVLTSCRYALAVLIPYMVFTNNRFLSPPSSSALSLSLRSIAYWLFFSTTTHTHSLSLAPLRLNHHSHFAHFDGCVRGVAPLVASAYLVVRVHHILHPALHLVSLRCVFRLCVFLRVFALLSNFITTHFISCAISHFVSLCFTSQTSSFAGAC